jgi:hypothetical protein
MFPGGIATIHGNYFYAPVQVTFTGGAVGEITSISTDNQLLQVKIPAGAQPVRLPLKQILAKPNLISCSGMTGNMLITNDPWSGWWVQIT